MSKLDLILKFTLALMAMLPCIVQGVPLSPTPKPEGVVTCNILPVATKPGASAGAPSARVFGNRPKLYVYASVDSVRECKTEDSGDQPGSEGYFYAPPGFGKTGFCNTHYWVWATEDPDLKKDWTQYISVLNERDVPWVYKPEGFLGAGRMGAPDAVEGDDGYYYLFFSAPKDKDTYAIGVARAEEPYGPFKARPEPMEGTEHPGVAEPKTGTTSGMDPSIMRLNNGKWVMFSVNQTQHYYSRCDESNSGVNWQYINPEFTVAEKPHVVRGLLPEHGDPYMRAPFAEYRNGNLYLYYSEKSSMDGFRVRQAVANSPRDPAEGFKPLGVTIDQIDYRSNHASVVTFKGKSWAFYHQHFEEIGATLRIRKTGYSPVEFKCDGSQEMIVPTENNDHPKLDHFISITDNPKSFQHEHPAAGLPQE